MGRRSSLVAAAVGVLAAVAPAGVARADPAGPTDYGSQITAITPATPGVRAEIVGGDSFLRLIVEPGNEVVVSGYAQEPYLHFDPAGVVTENQHSPATYLNASRYGAKAPADADPTLPPDWKIVGTGGSYAWHDHRAHWMSPSPPEGVARGGQVQSSDVPIVVNGTPVVIEVVTTYLPEPSRLPLAIGAAVGGALVLLALFWRRRTGLALLAVALAATGIGWWQFASLPSETGPLLVWWVLPAVATVSLLVALALGRRLVSYALVLLAAMELAVWVWLRRDGAFRAVIPTDAPFWLDRGVMAATAVVAVIAAIAAAVAMFRLPVGDG
jgi:hypothetical protein